jgi:outer membrane protein TolC
MKRLKEKAFAARVRLILVIIACLQLPLGTAAAQDRNGLIASTAPAPGDNSPILRPEHDVDGVPSADPSNQPSNQPSGQSPSGVHKRYPLPLPAPSGAFPEKIEAKLRESSSEESIKGPLAADAMSSNKDNIGIGRPPLKALISVNDYLSPFGLDASSSKPVRLRDVLLAGIDRNLDLAISRTKSKVQQWNLYGALGKFLPDVTMTFQEFFLKGAVGLPFKGGVGAGSSGLVSGSASSLGTGTSPFNENTIHLDTPFLQMGPGFRYYGYQGGKILFGMLQAKHNYHAAKSGEKATLGDTLFKLSKDYYNLELAEAILQIRIQAVKTSETQLRDNTNRFHSGLATNLDVLQSTTQLSRDRQNLVDQQIARRNLAITLAQDVNADLGEDLLPVDTTIRKIRLIDPRMTVSDMLRLAIDNRPELKQFEELRLAARRGIVISGSKLQPTFSLSGNILGIGPPRQLETLRALGMNVNWQLGGLGTVDSAAVEASRWQARQAMLESNKELVTVLGQVRSSLNTSLDTEHNIEESSNEVASSAEELRLAQLRFQSGLGTNLDIITAQRDYTQALIDKAQALINFDIAQVQLLHDIGLTSVDAVTSGRLTTK